MSRQEPKKGIDEATRLLADPTRYRILCSIVENETHGVSTAQIAEQFGLHRNVARMHLEKLARAGLLASSLRKPAGGGRPARLYRVGETVTRQFPPRNYQLLAEVALTALEQKEDPLEAARRIGRFLGEQALARAGLERETAIRKKLMESFYQAVGEQGMMAGKSCPDPGTLEVKVLNCVFRELSAHHANLVCGIHEQILLGLCESHFGKVGLQKGQMAIAKGGMSCRYTIKIQL